MVLQVCNLIEIESIRKQLVHAWSGLCLSLKLLLGGGPFDAIIRFLTILFCSEEPSKVFAACARLTSKALSHDVSALLASLFLKQIFQSVFSE